MISREDVIQKSKEFGFEDVGFTTAEPFETHKKILADRREEYGWTEDAGLELMKGTDPKAIMEDAETVIVLMEVNFREAYPRRMEGHFGRCYLDDDRVTKEGLAQRIKGSEVFCETTISIRKRRLTCPIGWRPHAPVWEPSERTACFIPIRLPDRGPGSCPLPW